MDFIKKYYYQFLGNHIVIWWLIWCNPTKLWGVIYISYIIYCLQYNVRNGFIKISAVPNLKTMNDRKKLTTFFNSAQEDTLDLIILVREKNYFVIQ